MLFERREFGQGRWKLPEVFDSQRHCIAKRSEFNFIIVPRIEQSHRTALVKPAFEFVSSHLGGWVASRINPGHTKRDDFFFYFYKHP